MASLAEELPKEQARVREILAQYQKIGSAGAFGTIMIEQSLKSADEAIMSGDLPAMLQAYQDLMEIE